MDSNIQYHKDVNSLPNDLQINAILMKTEMRHFIELDKPILKYIYNRLSFNTLLGPKSCLSSLV